MPNKDPNKTRETYIRWMQNNKERSLKYHREYNKRRYDSEPCFRLKAVLRSRIGVVLKSKKPRSTVNLLGCSISDLKLYLESKFKDGMSWENYGEWHIDHIKPLAAFNLLDEKEISEALHYTNLQPLWAIENMKKGAKFEETGRLIKKTSPPVSLKRDDIT